jgi:hypothetical protein
MRKANARHWSDPNQACRWHLGIPALKTHDYRRHGTVTLFAALNYLEGTLISRTEQRHSMSNGCGS